MGFLTDVEYDSNGEVISGIPFGVYTNEESDQAPVDGSRGPGYFFKAITREPTVPFGLP